MKVLLVDDCLEARRLYREFLKMFGHEVTLAENAFEALKLMDTSEAGWDVLISDFNMPKMNGIELIETVFERHFKFQRIILFSGTLSTDPSLKSLECRCAHDPRFCFVNKDEGVERLNALMTAA